MAATLPFDDLPPSLQKSLQATATITVAELHNEGMAAANNPQEWPFAQISEILDHRTCPLCRRVDGMILRVGTPEYAKWRAPSHINCRRTLIYISREEQNVRVDFEEPDAELIRKHGHYHVNPEKHAELRIPAEPAGRHVVVRRVKNLETGEIGTRLDWAPWFEQVPQWQRDLVLQARATSDEAQLTQILEKLGITDPTQGEGFRTVARLGLRDRIEGWVSVFNGPPWNNPARPTVLVAQHHAEAEAWALQNLPGLQHVDYSGMDLDAVNELNRVAADITSKFGSEIPRILPKDSALWPQPLQSEAPVFWTRYGLAYDPAAFQGVGKQLLLADLAQRGHVTAASRNLAALFAHELGHALLYYVPGMTSNEALTLVVQAATAFRRALGAAAVRAELGDYAWTGGAGETWAEAFSAYWEEVYSIRPETKALVEDLLRKLFPGVTLP